MINFDMRQAVALCAASAHTTTDVIRQKMKDGLITFQDLRAAAHLFCDLHPHLNLKESLYPGRAQVYRQQKVDQTNNSTFALGLEMKAQAEAEKARLAAAQESKPEEQPEPQPQQAPDTGAGKRVKISKSRR